MTAAPKVRDWRARRDAAIERWRRTPYSEENNCGVFLADCVEAMTGIDYAKPFRGRFKTIAEGEALLRAAGFADLGAFLAARFAEIHPSRTADGDLALVPVDGGWAAGIVTGERLAMMGPKGLVTVSRGHAARGFRVQ